MKNKNIVCILLIFLLCINLPLIIGASPSIIDANYNFSDVPFNFVAIQKTDSIVLRIKTTVETSCTYGTSSSPSTSFEGEYGFTHEAYLKDLEEGFHKYYVRCGDSLNPVMEVNFATSVPIYATIKLSESPPLREGKYTINLITSKTSLGTPTLEYSFDDLVYRPISLKGSGEKWEGNLIIPASTGEAICSLRFKAKDLSGEEGTKITGDNLFIVDTSSPSAISIINAVGYEGQIKLNWFVDEEIAEFNIYRSENPQVEYTEFYKTSSKNSFYDNNVEKGRTYYYRVVGVDEAGNIGDLSKEVYATALLSNYSKDSGLDARLVGKVDNSISEITSVIQDIDEINSLIDLKDEKERNLFTEIKLDKELDGAISELNSLKRDTENYKLQDLSEVELDKKIASTTLKLNIIKKKVPEDITIVSEKQVQRSLTEENIQKAYLEYFPTTEVDYKKEISDTLKIIKDNNLGISSNFYQIEIMYLDGTKKQITLVEDSISPQLTDLDELYFVIAVPKEIAEKSSELKFMNLEYDIIKDDPVISFKSNTKEIIYYLNKEMNIDSLEDILIAPIKVPSSEVKTSTITGNTILNFASKGSWGIIALVIFAFILIVYLLKMKSETSIKPVLTIIEEIKKSKELLKEGKEEEAKELYKRVKEEYKTLSEKERKIVMEGIKNIDEEISR